MIAFLLTLLSVASSTETFPEQFRGDWYWQPTQCRKDQVSLRIGETRFDSLSEYNGEIDRLVESSGNSITVDIRFWAEGHRWKGRQVLTLNKTGAELLNDPARPNGKYYRCTPKLGERG